MLAVSVEHLSKRYGNLLALNDVSLQVQEGEFFGLLGPNGAGKTTLISILAGLCRPDQGESLIMGTNVQSHFLEARRMLGVVPQELVFDPFFTVRETLQFQSGYFGIRNSDAPPPPKEVSVKRSRKKRSSALNNLLKLTDKERKNFNLRIDSILKDTVEVK